jgi:D-3-phosphoglycerate dehydrogenase
MQHEIDRFRVVFNENNIELVIPKVEERLEEDELLPLVNDIDGAICGDDRFAEKVLRSAPNLKVISKWGTGIDSIDKKACQALDIAVCNTPDAFSEPVADSVIGYMLCFARNIPWMNGSMKKGIWDKIPGRALNECILGVIGVGNVGKALIRRAAAFGMQLLGNDIKEIPADYAQKTELQMVSKEKLLQTADFVSLNCDLNPSSYHLIAKDEFRQMKTNAVIINTARGPIIDEKALIQALENRELAGAALDVFENEPLPDDSPLQHMDNVLLSPHNANSSPAAWEKVHWSTIQNLLEVLEKDKP